jgi:hypothetical protein
MTLLITVNNKHIFNVAFINVISKVIKSEVFISIVVVPNYQTGGKRVIVSNTLTYKQKVRLHSKEFYNSEH